MVKGLAKFREHFRGFEDEFILIGGAACDEWFSARGLRYRATKDLDIVIIIEALTPDFLRHFWQFVRTGQYAIRERTSGKHEYFRFSRPQKADYPVKIELFSRNPEDLVLFGDQEIIPIYTGEDISSLSAILLNEEYYFLILKTRKIQDGLPIVQVDGLILLKARAWLDLTRRREAGKDVDKDDILKHRNDVFRLALLLLAGGKFELPESIRADLVKFLESFPSASPDWPAILNSLRVTFKPPPSPDIIRQALKNYFSL
jgi:predicted nucleotidyltransferase